MEIFHLQKVATHLEEFNFGLWFEIWIEISPKKSGLKIQINREEWPIKPTKMKESLEIFNYILVFMEKAVEASHSRKM